MTGGGVVNMERGPDLDQLTPLFHNCQCDFCGLPVKYTRYKCAWGAPKMMNQVDHKD